MVAKHRDSERPRPGQEMPRVVVIPEHGHQNGNSAGPAHTESPIVEGQVAGEQAGERVRRGDQPSGPDGRTLKQRQQRARSYNGPLPGNHAQRRQEEYRAAHGNDAQPQSQRRIHAPRGLVQLFGVFARSVATADPEVLLNQVAELHGQVGDVLDTVRQARGHAHRPGGMAGVVPHMAVPYVVSGVADAIDGGPKRVNKPVVEKKGRWQFARKRAADNVDYIQTRWGAEVRGQLEAQARAQGLDRDETRAFVKAGLQDHGHEASRIVAQNRLREHEALQYAQTRAARRAGRRAVRSAQRDAFLPNLLRNFGPRQAANYIRNHGEERAHAAIDTHFTAQGTSTGEKKSTKKGGKKK